MTLALHRFTALALLALSVGCGLDAGPADARRDSRPPGGGPNCTRMLCGASCVDPMTDPLNCATCGHVCPTLPNGLAICIAGICSERCSPGFSDCNAGTDGCETDLRSPMSCGHCVAECGTGNLCFAGDLTAGHCSTVCDATTTRCASSCVALQTDAQNCGGCGTICHAGPQQVPTCTAGHCATPCAPGRGDCDHLEPNGCEVDTTSDPANCGGCGTACTQSQCCNASTCGDCMVVGARAVGHATPPT